VAGLHEVPSAGEVKRELSARLQDEWQRFTAGIYNHQLQRGLMKKPMKNHRISWFKPVQAMFILIFLGAVGVAHAQTLGEALNATNLTWITSGNVLWFAETNATHDGIAAAQSAIAYGQSSVLQTTIAGPGTLTYWCKIAVLYQGSQSSQLAFNDGGGAFIALPNVVDGTNWQQHTIYLGSGNQVVQWNWQNDGKGTNIAWLDQVNYTPGTTSPFITSEPTELLQVPGLSATFTVIAAGTPPLNYQWFFNDTNILGATNSSFSLTNVLKDSFGNYHVVATNTAGATVSSNAMLRRGQIAAWGGNLYDVTTTVPLDLTNVLAVRGGFIALKADGTVFAWGYGGDGQTNVPTGLSNVVAIAAGCSDCLALKSDGTVVTWGQAGNPPLLTNVAAIAGDCGGGLALRTDGTVIGWHDPIPPNLTNIVMISAQGNQTLALRTDGIVIAWDYLGHIQTNVPDGLTNAVAISAGLYHNVVLRADGTVVAWGYNGDGETNVPAGLSNVVAIAAGDTDSMALKSDGTIVMWGAAPGGLGNLSDVTAISAGGGFCLALVGDSPPVLHAPLSDPLYDTNGFSVSVPSQSGRVYRLEYVTSLADSNWTALPLVAGNGGKLILTDSTATNGQRFYRVRQW
jgi:hypothetical protein